MHAQLLPVLCLLAGQVAAPSGSSEQPTTRITAPVDNSGLRSIPAESVQLKSVPSRALSQPASSAGIKTELGAPVLAKSKIADRSAPPPPRAVASGEMGPPRPPVTPAQYEVDAPRDERPVAGALADEPESETQTPVEEEVAPPPRVMSSEVATANGSSAGNPLRGVSQAANQEYDRQDLSADRAAAPALLRHAMSAPRDPSWELPGEPATLQTVLERTGERAQRLAVVRAYWRMTADVAKYYWSVEELEFLAELPSSRSPGEGTMLVVAQGDAQAQTQQAKVVAAISQTDLSEMMRMSTHDAAPLPYDVPLVGAYQTKFDRIFAGRTPPPGLRRIATAIPLQQEVIELRAASVAAATESLKELNHEYRQGQVALGTVVEAQVRLRRMRNEFVDAIRSYNEMIAEYALTIGAGSNNQTVVGMLIKNPAQARTAQASATQGTRPANINQPGMLPSNGFVPNTSGNHMPPPTMPPTSRGTSSHGTSSSGTARISRDPAMQSSPRPSTWMAPRATVGANSGVHMSDGAAAHNPGGSRYPAPPETGLDEANARPTLPNDASSEDPSHSQPVRSSATIRPWGQ